jgi:hypothetical protein
VRRPQDAGGLADDVAEDLVQRTVNGERAERLVERREPVLRPLERRSRKGIGGMIDQGSLARERV